MERRSGVILGVMFICWSGHVTLAHREHKVHNIVLYPDKHSWCKTTPIKQVVVSPGCESVEMDNSVCVGACFSYSIPRTVPSSPGEVIKPYCDSCQPSEVVWNNVKLKCDGEEGEMQKRVQLIMNCSCSTCDLGDDSGSLHPLTSSGDGEKQTLLGVQEFMEFIEERGKDGRTGPSNITDPEMNKKLLSLLKHFNGEDEESSGSSSEGGETPAEEKLDMNLLKDLLRQVEGSDHKVNQATLGEIVRNVEDREHIKVNLNKLRHVLSRLERNDTEGSTVVHHHHGHHPESHRHHQHHHVVQEEPAASGQDEPQLDPTLDVAPHHFKPALGGAEMSYHGNELPREEDADKELSEEEEF